MIHRGAGFFRIRELEVQLPHGFEVYQSTELVGLLCDRCRQFVASYPLGGDLSPMMFGEEAHLHLVTEHGQTHAQ